jgi:SAM-dependent methyltransferase
MSSRFPATNADGYELQMGRWSRVLAPKFFDFAQVQPGSRVLDLGCGTGSLTRVLLERTGGEGSVVGVDVSAPFIEHAKAEITDPRVSFELQDATELAFPDGSFDAVLSLLVLNFVPECRNAITEMLRVARSGGVVAAATWDIAGGLMIARMFLDTAALLDEEAAEVRAKGRRALLTHDGELAAAFREAGALEVEEIDLLIRMKFADFGDYWSSFLSGQSPPGAYLSALDDVRRERLR